MRISNPVMLAALALLGSVSAASAQSVYYGVHGGLNLAHDSDITQGGSTLETEFDLGFAVGGFVGYDFTGGFRVDGEFTYRGNDVDTLDGVGVDGDVSALSFMVNGFYDFDIGSTFTPYVGGGVGIARVSINDLAALGIPLADDDDTVFAYQVGAGVSFPVSPAVNMTLDYRYFATDDGSFTDAGGFAFDAEYSTSTFLVGVRATF